MLLEVVIQRGCSGFHRAYDEKVRHRHGLPPLAAAVDREQWFANRHDDYSHKIRGGVASTIIVHWGLGQSIPQVRKRAFP
jgi:hypothetical protein